jgi:hypothetical protein
MKHCFLSGLRNCLVTAASCAVIALPVGYVSESANSLVYKDPISHSRALFYSAIWTVSTTASLSLKKRKLRRQEEQRIADSTHQLSLYIKEIKKDPRYSKDYISLLQSLSNPKDFFFRNESSFAEGVEGSCCHVTNTITMKKIIPDSGDHGNPSTLPHELTHALRREPFPDPKQCDYSSYMKSMLQEECVAVSSENYGCTELLAGGKFPKISMLDQEQQKNLDSFSRDIRDSNNPASYFLYDDKKILIAAIIHSMVAQSVYQTPNFWWTYYTEHYNEACETDHQLPDNGFETPLLPPTLARQVSGVFDRIFQRIPENQRHQHPVWQRWMSMTGIDLDTLQLAAVQKKWPTYPSEVFTEMRPVSNGR